MSERLTINIRTSDHNEPIAAIFFRNSATVKCSTELAISFIEKYYSDEMAGIEDPRLRLVRICESNGGGIDGVPGDSEWKYISAIFPEQQFKANGICDYKGLIALSAEQIADMNRISQGLVDIMLGSSISECSIRLGPVIKFADYDEMCETYREEFDELPKLVSIDLSIDLTGELSYQELKILNDSLTDEDDYYECNGQYYMLI